MKEIKIEDDLFEDLLERVVNSGKSFSDVIREFRDGKANMDKEKESKNKNLSHPEMELQKYAQSTEFTSLRSHLEKFLAILGKIHQLTPNEFDKVEQLQGHKRKYFAKSSKELSQYGSSVFPKRIPNSPYWVITNNSTVQKRDMVKSVLLRLGYDKTFAKNIVKNI